MTTFTRNQKKQQHVHFVNLLVSWCWLMMTCGAARTSYKRSSYPEYCSIPSVMSAREIPPLQYFLPKEQGDDDNEHEQEQEQEEAAEDESESMTAPSTQILQASVIIRHGARTPLHPPNLCWRQDHLSSYPSHKLRQVLNWDCTIRSIAAPAIHPVSPSSSQGHENNRFVFEKYYNALKPPLHNVLNGTCQLGQLLEEGYQMEVTNGRHLQQAYIYTPQPHMQLFPTPNYAQLPHSDAVYLRVDDIDRTFMSAQILFTGLFDATSQNQDFTYIPVHVADLDMDILSPRADVCPRLNDLQSAAQSSPEYIEFSTHSPQAHAAWSVMMNDLRPEVGVDEAKKYMLSCLMTHYCTDRPLPDVLDDYDTLGEDSVFRLLYNYSVFEKSFHYTYNHSAYAKLATGPLWSEIYNPLKRTKRATTLQDMQDWNLPRLLLFSGHDSTLAAMMASLGDGVWDGEWIPYASMFLIESHAITSGPHPQFPSQHAFRLLYNGKVITHRIQGCPSHLQLCDLDVLLQILEPFATLDRDCSPLQPPPTTQQKEQEEEVVVMGQGEVEGSGGVQQVRMSYGGRGWATSTSTSTSTLSSSSTYSSSSHGGVVSIKVFLVVTIGMSMLCGFLASCFTYLLVTGHVMVPFEMLRFCPLVLYQKVGGGGKVAEDEDEDEDEDDCGGKGIRRGSLVLSEEMEQEKLHQGNGVFLETGMRVVSRSESESAEEDYKDEEDDGDGRKKGLDLDKFVIT